MQSDVIRIAQPQDNSDVVPSIYQNLYKSNPYRNLTYYKSPWQNFLTRLGFRTQADAWKENMEVQANEFDAALMSKIQEDQYNSPSQQSARMKAAGLNPDLDPSSIDSGQAAPMGEDLSTPMQSTGEENVIAGFADTLMQILTMSVGLAGSVQGLERNRIQNSLLAIQEDSDIASFAERTFPYLLEGAPFLGEGATYDDFSAESWQELSRKNAELFTKGFNPRTRKKYMDVISSFWNGALGESKSFEEFQRNIQARFGYDVAKKTYLDEQGEISDIITSELSDLSKELLRLRMSAEKSSLEGQEAEGQYDKEYFGALNGESAADVVNKGNEFQSVNLNMTKILNQHLDNIIDKLQKYSEESGIKGGAASMALSMLGIFRLMLISNGLPSVSRSNNSSFNPSSGAVGNGQSFSIGF